MVGPNPPDRNKPGSPESIDSLYNELWSGYLALRASLAAAAGNASGRRPWFKFPFPERKRKHAEELAAQPERGRAIQEAYAVGAVIAFADELAKYDGNDKSPQFEFVRHIRNAIGHGNRFDLSGRKTLKRLEKRPAFLFRSNGSLSHRIKPKLDGKKCLGKFIDVSSVFAALDAANVRVQEIESGFEANVPVQLQTDKS